MKNEESGNGFTSLILPFFIGGVIGAGVALLLAPKSGRETRQVIKETAGTVKEKAGTYAEQVKGTVTSTVEKGKGIFQEKKAVISSAIEAGKEAYGKEKEKLLKPSSEPESAT
jgi:gas vesicle protein